MYDVIFYTDQNDYSELYEQIMTLEKNSQTNKDARIQINQIKLAIELLELGGAKSRMLDTKHIRDDIWELRPGNNRILYFFFKDNKYVLLHMFRKKTQKTPIKEIERALREANDYKNRFGGK